MDKKYIDIDGDVYSVSSYEEGIKLKKGWAYIIKNKLVLPYLGKLKSGSKRPGIYMVEEDEYVFLKPITKKKMKMYRPDKVYTIDLNFINKIIETDGVRNSEDLEILLSETDEVFSPPILDDDNALQKLIKQALEKKQIDLKNYLSRFGSASNMNNKKRSLFHHGKMSLEKYIEWCDVLDLNFEIKLTDTSNAVHPMNEELVYKYK